ncbi:hypothetical protein D4764_06G0001980 [Takifugu flavidus]|uniref:Murine leukemia virus integrase C-terminal domain-containing protein n=1 Tax=Takifugu flavidus TaxID=433684 RepID=A0A5C6MWI5_9TELE|nr:hypothetical protein D4764_06G0001980 [Takifugu flavidus]
MPTLSQAEAADVGEAEAEGEEEATPVKMIGVIIVKIMDTGNVIAKRNNVTRDTIEDSSKPEAQLHNQADLHVTMHVERIVRKSPPSTGWRMVQDLQAVNAAVVPRSPLVADPYTLLNDLNPEHQWYTGIDVSNAFFSVPVHPDSQFWFALRFKDGGTPGQGYLRATPNLTIRRCTTLNPATLLPTAEEGHQHNCLDEVSTKVLPRPDLNSTTQEPIQPGDYVWVKKFVRKRWNTPRWEGPYQVQLTTKTAVRVDGKLSWIHFPIVKNRKFFQVKAREQWRTLRKRLTACIGPATAEPRRNL